MSITTPNGSVNLINVIGKTVNWSGGLTLNGSDEKTASQIFNTLYNFVDATAIDISGTCHNFSYLA